MVSVLLFLCLFAGVEGVYLWKQQKTKRAILQKIAMAKNKKITLLGNSHAHFGGYIGTENQAINLAFPSELLVFTYLKIKLLQPKTVLVALNPQHLQKNNEDALKNGLLSEDQYNYLYACLDDEAQEALRGLCPFEQWAFFRVKQWLPFLGSRLKATNEAELLGGFKAYHSQRKVSTQGVKNRLKTVFELYNYQQSELQLTYLKEIIRYCSQHHIKLVLVSFPLHPLFFENIPPQLFREFKALLKKMRQLGDFEHWDYTQQFANSALFYDPDHLNEQGAKTLSKLIFDRLRKQ